MSQDFTISEQNGQFVYKKGDLSITIYEDGVAIHGARDPFANETWNVLFGSDVANGLFCLFSNPEVMKRYVSPDT